MSENKFDNFDIVVHVKTDKRYQIIAVPFDFLRIESCNEPYYVYRNPKEKDPSTQWVRPKSEMEDGRFISIEEWLEF
jgi:hypothetical protein